MMEPKQQRNLTIRLVMVDMGGVVSREAFDETLEKVFGQLGAIRMNRQIVKQETDDNVSSKHQT